MKKRMAKASLDREPKPKAIAYQFIPLNTEEGKPLYERVYAIVDTHHENISQANVRIALAWAKSWKPDVDGRLTLGKCKKASDLDRELAPYDFVILLNRDWWFHPKTTDEGRQAVLDHECCHMEISRDTETGEPIYDDRGRNVFRMRKHTIEEFTEIVDRHGIYKADVEAFAQAVYRAEHATGRKWIGYTSLAELLLKVGVTVEARVIATWTDDERRDVHTWALMHGPEAGERVNCQLSSTMPAILAAAVRQDPPAAAVN